MPVNALPVILSGKGLGAKSSMGSEVGPDWLSASQPFHLKAGCAKRHLSLTEEAGMYQLMDGQETVDDPHNLRPNIPETPLLSGAIPRLLWASSPMRWCSLTT